ncbi:hypothetical protein O9992_23705 [Vibrio lentus]|nr:hypothetical protein [Vibrio lentus]
MACLGMKNVHGRRWYSSPFIVKPAKALLEGAINCNPALKPMTCLKLKDIAATILEIADVEHPGTEYQGREVAPMKAGQLTSLALREAGHRGSQCR